MAVKSTKRKVNFFEIITPADADSTFEQILCDISGLSVTERRHYQAGDNDEEFHQIHMFKPCSETSNMYQGIYMKCTANSITASSDTKVELKEAQLPTGYRPTYISHFVYSPQTGILSIESSQHAPKQLSMMRYVNYMQLACLKRDSIRFQARPIINDDVAKAIRASKGVRAFELTISSGELAAADKRGDWLGLMSRLSGKGNTGRLTIGLSGARGRGDMTEVMSVEELANEFENGEFSHVQFGAIRAELIYEQQAIAVNLLQNKIKSDIEVPVLGVSQYSSEIYSRIREVYATNRDQLTSALSTVAIRQYEQDKD